MDASLESSLPLAMSTSNIDNRDDQDMIANKNPMYGDVWFCQNNFGTTNNMWGKGVFIIIISNVDVCF